MPTSDTPGPHRRHRSIPDRWRLGLVAILTILAVIAGVSGAYLLLGDTFRAAQYSSSTPQAIEEPNLGVPLPPREAPVDQPESDVHAREGIHPERIDIPDAKVNTIVEPAAASERVNPFTGETVLTFPVPGGPFTTVWWEEGPAPGEDGMAVILGHTRSKGASVFEHLADLDEGAAIGVSGLTESGETVVARFIVTSVVTEIPKSDDSALRSVLDTAPADTGLALITCGGEVDQILSSHSDNTVVFATLDAVYRR